MGTASSLPAGQEATPLPMPCSNDEGHALGVAVPVQKAPEINEEINDGGESAFDNSRKCQDGDSVAVVSAVGGPKYPERDFVERPSRMNSTTSDLSFDPFNIHRSSSASLFASPAASPSSRRSSQKLLAAAPWRRLSWRRKKTDQDDENLSSLALPLHLPPWSQFDPSRTSSLDPSDLGTRDQHPDCAVCFKPFYYQHDGFLSRCCQKLICDECDRSSVKCAFCNRFASSGSGGEELHRLQLRVHDGDPESQHQLGLAYLKGLYGLRKDPANAAHLFELAAEQKFAPAQHDFAKLLAEGDGRQMDIGLSIQYFDLAARGGCTEAEKDLAIMKCFENGPLHRQRIDAEQGDTRSILDLARRFEVGDGVPQDDDRALRFYGRAADQGDPEAQRQKTRLKSLQGALDEDGGEDLPVVEPSTPSEPSSPAVATCPPTGGKSDPSIKKTDPE